MGNYRQIAESFIVSKNSIATMILVFIKETGSVSSTLRSMQLETDLWPVLVILFKHVGVVMQIQVNCFRCLF